MLGETFLNLLLIQELSRILEGERELLLEHVPVGSQLFGMSVLKLAKGLSIFLLGLEQVFVPLLVEFLVLLDVGLLALLSLLSLVEDELAQSPVIVLLLELGNSVLGHLSLNILALLLTSEPVILENSTESKSDWIYLHKLLNIILVRFLVKGLVFLFHLHCANKLNCMVLFYFQN